jgi:large subunit ribosomal protein L18
MIKRYKHKKLRRIVRIRSRILAGSQAAFKLVVNRSNKYLTAQVVNLNTGATVAGVKAKKAAEVGAGIAKKAKKIKVEKVVFDRGAYKYHGRVKQLAEAAREAGLKF